MRSTVSTLLGTPHLHQLDGSKGTFLPLQEAKFPSSLPTVLEEGPAGFPMRRIGQQKRKPGTGERTSRCRLFRAMHDSRKNWRQGSPQSYCCMQNHIGKLAVPAQNVPGNVGMAHQDHSWWATIVGWCVGGVLLSHTPPGAVPSALGSLASGFGMGPGGPSPLSPPTTLSPHTPTRGWGSLLVVL